MKTASIIKTLKAETKSHKNATVKAEKKAALLLKEQSGKRHRHAA